MRLENSQVRFSFDRANGSLVQIEDLRNGHRHLQDPAWGRLFRIIVPEEGKWSGRYIDSYENTPSEMTLTGDTLTLHYPNLRFVTTGEPSGISAMATIRLPDGTDEALFSLQVVNNGPDLIHEIWYPQVGGWQGYSGPEKDKVAFGVMPQEPAFFKRKGFAASTILNHHRRKLHTLPWMSLPMMDISDGSKGLSYICYGREYRYSGIVYEDQSPRKGDMQPSWSWVSFPFLKTGQSWTSPVVGIAPHGGDWHNTANRLRHWVETWWQAPQGPERLRDAIGFFSVLCRDFDGLERTPLALMPEIARYAKAHGMEDLGIWDSTHWKYMRADNGDFFEEDAARMDQWRAVLADIRSAGVHVHPLVNVRLTVKTNSTWQKDQRLTVKSLYGQEALKESYPICGNSSHWMNRALEKGGTVLCQCDTAFQKLALSLVDQAQELGFDSYFVDQAFEAGCCFDKSHSHPIPVHLHTGVLEWVSQIGPKLRSRDPDACVLGENTDIWNSQYIDIAWNWSWADWASERYRYTLPYSPQAWVIDALEHEDQVGKAFSMGFLLGVIVRGLEERLEQAPEFARRIKRLSDLRKRTAGFTVRGRFVHHDGLDIATDVNATVSVYDAEDTLGIVLGETAAYGAPGGGTIKLILDTAFHHRPQVTQIQLYREDGSTGDLPFTVVDGKAQMSVTLQRWECAVLKVH